MSVEKTRQVNQAAIAAGRCTVQQGNVAALPDAAEFDLITAFETVYFWPDGSFSHNHRLSRWLDYAL